MIKRFVQESRTITAGAAFIAVAGLLSRLLGIYRDRLLATTFGAGSVLDAYYAAFRIPDLLFNLLVLGALSAGFIPVFVAFWNKNKEEAWQLAQGLFWLLSVSLLGISLLLALIADPLVHLLFSGFDAQTARLTVTFTRIMLLSPILLGISGLFGGILQSLKRFVLFAVAPIFYNLGIIAGILWFVPWLGEKGLAWSVVFGASLHVILQLLGVLALGWRPLWRPFWKQQGISEVLMLMGPRTASLGISQVTVVFLAMLASRLPEGSIAIFQFTQNIGSVPIGLFGVSYAVAAFPALSDHAAQKREHEFWKVLWKTTLHITAFLLPCLCILAVFTPQITSLILGGGKFTQSDVMQTTFMVRLFLISSFAQSLLPLFARAYYAKQNTAYPFWTSIAGFGITMVCGFLFSAGYGLAGMTVAYGLASVVQLILLVWPLRKPVIDTV